MSVIPPCQWADEVLLSLAGDGGDNQADEEGDRCKSQGFVSVESCRGRDSLILGASASAAAIVAKNSSVIVLGSMAVASR